MPPSKDIAHPDPLRPGYDHRYLQVTRAPVATARTIAARIAPTAGAAFSSHRPDSGRDRSGIHQRPSPALMRTVRLWRSAASTVEARGNDHREPTTVAVSLIADRSKHGQRRGSARTDNPGAGQKLTDSTATRVFRAADVGLTRTADLRTGLVARAADVVRRRATSTYEPRTWSCARGRRRLTHRARGPRRRRRPARRARGLARRRRRLAGRRRWTCAADVDFAPCSRLAGRRRCGPCWPCAPCRTGGPGPSMPCAARSPCGPSSTCASPAPCGPSSPCAPSPPCGRRRLARGRLVRAVDLLAVDLRAAVDLLGAVALLAVVALRAVVDLRGVAPCSPSSTCAPSSTCGLSSTCAPSSTCGPSTPCCAGVELARRRRRLPRRGCLAGRRRLPRRRALRAVVDLRAVEAFVPYAASRRRRLRGPGPDAALRAADALRAPPAEVDVRAPRRTRRDLRAVPARPVIARPSRACGVARAAPMMPALLSSIAGTTSVSMSIRSGSCRTCGSPRRRR